MTSDTPAFEQADARNRDRKFVGFVGYTFAILFLVILFEDQMGQLSLVLGVAGAGVVVTLQDTIASLAGWLVKGFSRLYKPDTRRLAHLPAFGQRRSRGPH
jgi:hypothetical protein